MPVRKIPKNHVSVTGLHASTKSIDHAEFESPLENDYLTLLDFDPTVSSYEVQPVRVPVPGVPKGYVPDVLVHFHPNSSGLTRPSALTEVKSADDYLRNQTKYAPKFRAADLYAAERGWVFVRLSERDIRSEFLSNLKFLRRYRRIHPDPADLQMVLDALAARGGVGSSMSLLADIAPDDDTKARLLPALWHLVATLRISVDLQVAFGGDVALKLAELDP